MVGFTTPSIGVQTEPDTYRSSQEALWISWCNQQPYVPHPKILGQCQDGHQLTRHRDFGLGLSGVALLGCRLADGEFTRKPVTCINHSIDSYWRRIQVQTRKLASLLCIQIVRFKFSCQAQSSKTTPLSFCELGTTFRAGLIDQTTEMIFVHPSVVLKGLVRHSDTNCVGN